MSKVWQVPAGGRLAIERLPDLQAYLAKLRGINKENEELFFAPRYSLSTHNPYLLHGMREAVDLIYTAIGQKNRILIWGDYDVDGVSATAIVLDTLKKIGARAMPYLPHREDDGYGLNRSVLEQMTDEFDLLVTVDCGIANKEEVDWLKSIGKNVIITDHHELPSEIAAVTTIHPRHPAGQYPWGQLCGAGVAWKLAQALLRDERNPNRDDPDQEKWLLDLALLGTVGDIMPLLDENRAIAKFGLAILERTPRPGLRAILEAQRLSGRGLSIEDVAFRVVPLLNAAGRMDHPQTALNALLADNPDTARSYVQRLQEYNQRRQSVTRTIMQTAYGIIDPQAPVIFAADMTWPAGVVGLVAGKLADEFSKPAVVIGSNGRHAVGSARGVDGVNILEGLQTASHHTIKLGGHAGAAGFSVTEEKISVFRVTVEKYFGSQQKILSAQASVKADAVISENILDWDTHDFLRKFEPFGPGNENPAFIIRNMKVVQSFPVGKKQQHTKVMFLTANGELEGIAFNSEQKNFLASSLDILGRLEVNNFRGRPRLQLSIIDAAPSGKVDIEEAVD